MIRILLTLPGVRKSLRKFRISLRDKRIAQMLNDMADSFVGQTKSNLKNKKDIHFDSFTPLKASTIQAKNKKGSRFARIPLKDTGLMSRVYRSKTASASDLESHVTVAASRRNVAEFHNEAGGNLPKREWFGIGTKTERRINQMIRAKMKTIVRL